MEKADLQEEDFSTRTKFILVLLLGLSVFVSYSKSFRNGFFYDDRNLITENPLVVNHEYSKIWKTDLFETTRGASQYYRPLVVAFFAFEYLVFKDNAGFYHLVNVILHFLCVLVLLKFAEVFLHKFRSNKKLAYFPAFLFALHPANSQTVYWIAARGDIIMTAGILGGVLSFLSNKKISYIFVPLTFALAVLSKELGLLYLILVPLCVFFVEEKKIKREYFYKFAVLIPLVAVYFIVRANIVGQGFAFNTEETFWRPEYGHLKRLLTVPSIWGYYLLRAFFPFFLNFESGIELFSGILRPQFFFGLLSVTAVSTAAFLMRRDKFWVFAVLFWTISLFPVLNIFPIFESGMEHYMYLPMTAFCVYSGSFFGGGRKRVILFFILCAVFSLIIFLRGWTWKSESDIWLDSAKKTAVYARHGWIRSRINLASSYISEAEKSDSDVIFVSKAESLYLEVKREYPGFSSVNIGLGNIYLIRGEYDSALVFISAAVRENPANYFLLNKLAFIYSALGDNNTALLILERAVELKSDYDEANANLAVLYFLSKDIQKSQNLFQSTEVTPRNQKIMKRLEIAFGSLRGQKFLRYHPEMKEAAALLGQAGFFSEKLFLLEEMAELNPEDPDIVFDLALCAALEIGDVSYALTLFDAGDIKFAGDSRFLRGKGLLHLSVGDTANSVLAFKEYLDRFPEDSFRQDIEKFLSEMKKYP